MIIGLPKRTLLAVPRVLGRKAGNERNVTPRRERRLGLIESFAAMMERQAALVIRGLGD
jgi:hypothetical protein